MKNIDHLGIAVPDLKAAIAAYQALGFQLDRTETVASQKVNTAFFAAGPSHIELLEPTAPDSPISKFLEKRGPGMHHVCVEVEDLDAALDHCKRAGVRLINETPVIGAGGHRVAFVHPKSAAGVLLEFLERRRDQ